MKIFLNIMNYHILSICDDDSILPHTSHVSKIFRDQYKSRKPIKKFYKRKNKTKNVQNFFFHHDKFKKKFKHYRKNLLKSA